MKRWMHLLLWGIGIGLFLWILSQMDRTAILGALKEASLPHVLFAVACFPLLHLTRAYRWHLIMHSANKNPTFYNSFVVFSVGLFLGSVTPGRVGEAIKIPLLKKDGVTPLQGIRLLIMDRFFDVALTGIIILVSFGYIFSWEVSVFIAAVIALSSLFLMRIQRIRTLWKDLHDKKMFVLRCELLTLLNWALYFLQMIILAQAFDIFVPATTFIAAVTLTNVLTGLPISPLGLGTREAGLLYFFLPLGISKAHIVAFSLTVFILNLLSSLIGAYFYIHSSVKGYRKSKII